MKLLFVHGWGFDSSIWDELARRFSDCDFWERGYFGAACPPEIAGPFVAVAHSFGTMRLLASLPAGCRGIVALNGFDRFSQCAQFPGVHTRVLDRMIARFADAPDAVLSDFRRSCGCNAPFGAIDRNGLFEDLLALRDGDCRKHTAQCGLPILSLQGGRDPILGEAMREAVFAGAGTCRRLTLAGAGHLLPLRESATCARTISAFMEQLT